MQWDVRDIADPRLDLIPFYDPASDAYPAERGLEDYPLRGFTWRVFTETVLDQQREGHCVGFAFAAEAAARPAVVLGVNDTWAHRHFYAAQAIDRAAGRHFPTGATLLAGAQATKQAGLIDRYSWVQGARRVREVARVVGYRGPMILALPWHSGMFRPDSDGLLRPTGSVVGWHAILTHRTSPKRERQGVRNSWGAGWGRGGDADLTYDDLGVLFEAGGFACLLEGRRVPARRNTTPMGPSRP